MAKPYTYVVARIRALEARMLSPAQTHRMLEAPDLDRAFFVLNETMYADHISATAHPFNFEEIIDAELHRTHSFLKRYAGEDEVLRLFWRKYDYGNVKALLRGFKKRDEEASSSTLSDFGNVGGDTLAAFIFKGEGSIPVWLEKAAGRALVAFEEGGPAEIDRVLDSAYLADLLKSPSELLRGLSTLWRGSLFPFDIDGDNRTIETLRGIKRRAFGIEPLIAYWMVKVFEAKTISQILVAKKNRLRLALIREKGRTSYV